MDKANERSDPNTQNYIIFDTYGTEPQQQTFLDRSSQTFGNLEIKKKEKNVAAHDHDRIITESATKDRMLSGRKRGIEILPEFNLSLNLQEKSPDNRVSYPRDASSTPKFTVLNIPGTSNTLKDRN